MFPPICTDHRVFRSGICGSEVWESSLLWENAKLFSKELRGFILPSAVYVSSSNTWYCQSSCCGSMGSVVSLEYWDTGLIPSLTQLVKDLAWDCNCSLDLFSGQGTPYAMGWKKKLLIIKAFINYWKQSCVPENQAPNTKSADNIPLYRLISFGAHT